VLVVSAHTGGQWDSTTAGVGVGVTAIGGIVGLMLLLQPDEATFTVTPLSVGDPWRAREGANAALPNGLAVGMRF
jgi:hypothetical protein